MENGIKMKKVVVVSASRQGCMRLVGILEACGVENIKGYMELKQAEEKLQKQPVDCIFLDAGLIQKDFSGWIYKLSRYGLIAIFEAQSDQIRVIEALTTNKVVDYIIGPPNRRRVEKTLEHYDFWRQNALIAQNY